MVPGFGAPVPMTAVPPASGRGADRLQRSAVRFSRRNGAMGWRFASLVIGIVGFCVPLIGIVAIISGRWDEETRDPQVGGRGWPSRARAGIIGTMFRSCAPIMLHL